MSVARLMSDATLPDAARVVGFHIQRQDKGEGVELRLDDVSAMLHGWPGPDKCRTVLRVLQTAGYVDRTPGGRGHGDTFTWVGGSDSMGSEPHPNTETAQDRVGPEPQSNLRSGSSPTLSTDSMGSEPHPKDALARARASSSYLPPPPPISAWVREAIESRGSLEGCRGSLVDYLAERVDPENQHAYAMTVAGWIEGTDTALWMSPGHGTVTEGRAKIVAGCLNELRACDEVGQYFPGGPGSTANLRTKIRYKVKSKKGAENDARRASDGTASATRSEAAGDGDSAFPEPVQHDTAA